MPLALVTGPANSGKAGELLRAYRARLDDDPILVVPRIEDVEHTRRELGEGGAVLGVRVVRFAGLFELMAERVEPDLAATPRAGALSRELLVAEAVRRAGLRTIGESARRPGFARAAARFLAELGRAMVDPPRLRRALLAWAGDGPRRSYAEDLAAIYDAYHPVLAEVGLVDDEQFARRALDVLRLEPRRFGATPVFAYGFDDFTRLELDALETLARHAETDVTVSLPFERGRVAFRANAAAFAALSELADEHVELEPSTAHYVPGGREALSRIERSLFEPGVRALGGSPAGATPPGEAVGLHVAGGRRAEVELAAAEVLRALRAGALPGDVVVVLRDPEAYATLVEEVFDAYGISVSLERSLPLGHTALGRGLVALLRCAAATGSADDLVAYLRTPGRLRVPALADRLEARVRREGTGDGVGARRLWEEGQWPLEEIDRLSRAAGSPGLLEELDDRLEHLFVAPYARAAHLLAGPEREDAAALRAARAALAELKVLAAAGVGPELEPAALADLLADVPVRVGERPGPERVRVAAPEAVRARRYATVLVLGLQEREFPRRAVAEPFLSDELRREVSEAAGLGLPIREDDLDRERHLFYVCASRADRRLVLSSRVTDEDGAPEAPSFFLDDVGELFGAGALEVATVRRSVGEVAWDLRQAPTELEHGRALAARGPRRSPPAPGGLRSPPMLAELASRRDFSAGELEAFAGCGIRWLVEKELRPESLEPDPEALVRGRLAHGALKLTLERLRERTGSARVTPKTLPEAESILAEALEELGGEHRISLREGRRHAARARLEHDLRRQLRREAAAGGAFEPQELELAFGLDREGEEAGKALPALALEPEGVRVRGRIDRVDVHGDRALVRDYKAGSRVEGVNAWDGGDRLQVPLYMLAARELLGLDPAGGVYVPLSGGGRPRGVVCGDDAEAIGGDLSGSDVRDRAAIEVTLASARRRVGEVVERIRTGDVRSCPERCGPSGGCRYPAICRAEEA
ncbi:MAG: PD-(D/E)XK nuclease family protein [Thermoleophilaceae bacterium]|nr:PD-(D/E)XK nuclease family protein [Thermoleophilaceae bacterium]